MAKMGQPTKCTDDLIAEIEKLLPTVMYIESVASFLGIDMRTVKDWMRAGRKEMRRQEKGEEPTTDTFILQCVKFVKAYKRGLAKGEAYDAGIIRKAAEKSWQAAAWRLERRFPERWSSDRRMIRELQSKLDKLEELIRQNQTDNA